MMTGDELARWLADPVDFLGDWGLQINVTTGTAGSKASVQVASSSESVDLVQYPAASNRVPLYLHKDADAHSYWVNTSVASKQYQTKTGYRLPWASHKACYTRLDDQADVFVTSRLNGCCVMICGEGDDVWVVHANRGDDAMTEAVVGLSDMRAANERRTKLFDAFYWDVMGRLIALGALSEDHPVTLFDPSAYSGGKNKGIARVHGIRGDSGWRFFASIDTTDTQRCPAGTRPVCVNQRIWPV